MASIAYTCHRCRQYSRVEIIEPQVLSCPKCSQPWGVFEDIKTIFARCPLCPCRQFYVQKDFNQTLGCLMLLIGIVLVPWTYGLSLPFFWLIDFVLYCKVPTMAVCYQCGTEFRGFEIPGHFKSFLHHIGVKYDKASTDKRRTEA